jgi:transcriptional regulator with XRE-family HTH domain
MLWCMDALQYVRTCLESTPSTTKEIAEGAGVGESWLRMFRRGEIPDPGYSRVKLLADYFLRIGLTPVLRDEQPASRHQQT